MNIEACINHQFWNTFHGGIIVAAIIAIGMLLVVAYVRYVNKGSLKWAIFGLASLCLFASAAGAFKASTGMYLSYVCSGALK